MDRGAWPATVCGVAKEPDTTAKGPVSSLCLFSLQEDTVRSWQSETWKVLTRTQPCQHPDLGLPAFRAVGDRFLLSSTYSIILWYFGITA